MPENKTYLKTADESGSINISEDVIAAIVATAAAEVKGVHGLYYSPGKELSQAISRRGVARSVKVIIGKSDVQVDIYILLSKDSSASEVGADVQKAIISAVEDSVGATVSSVNVHICGVVLKRKPQSQPEK